MPDVAEIDFEPPHLINFCHPAKAYHYHLVVVTDNVDDFKIAPVEIINPIAFFQSTSLTIPFSKTVSHVFFL